MQKLTAALSLKMITVNYYCTTIFLMHRLVFIILFCLPGFQGSAQIAEDLAVGLQMYLVKTDNLRLLEKAQIGAEVNYFITKKITATTGIEVWTNDEVSFLIGGRFYPAPETFIRLRGLVGANDVSIGGGWIKPLSETLRFEAIGDFYFKVDFAIRAGLIYVIRIN